jgi:hypothetical protein
MVGNWCTGNANDDATPTGAWLLGHFIKPADSVRSTEALEV